MNWEYMTLLKFQLTHSRGVRPPFLHFMIAQNDFNSRTHVECDRSNCICGACIIQFQLTHSRGVRLRFILPFIGVPAISTHALTWSATAFFTILSDIPVISTHALTWSATQSANRLSGWRKISTHALTWSATQSADRLSGWRKISTHALTWSATQSADRLSGWRKISTHALTWSATLCDFVESIIKSDFNSRTHVECDVCFYGAAYEPKAFQLTHSRGVRLQKRGRTRKQKNFNSRTHVECDKNQ